MGGQPQNARSKGFLVEHEFHHVFGYRPWTQKVVSSALKMKNENVRRDETGTYYSGNAEEVKDVATPFPYSSTAILVWHH